MRPKLLSRSEAPRTLVGMSADESRAITFRPVDLAGPEFDELFGLVRTVFKADRPSSPERTARRRLVNPDARPSAAFDGDRMVATFRSWDWAMTVPGGAQVEVDAISGVTVSPTHRRQGLMTELVSADLRAAVERGVAAASLIAAQATIYGRFGFGPSTWTTNWEVDLASATLRESITPTGRVDFVEGSVLAALAPTLVRAQGSAGEPHRNPLMWEDALGVVPDPDVEPKQFRHLLFRDDDGEPQGYLSYSWADDWDRWTPKGRLTIESMACATPTAYAELFRFILSIDNMATLTAKRRPVDEVLPWLLTDHRALSVNALDDFLWTRLLDVSAALSARTYESPGSVIFEVRDPLGHVDGTYLLEADDQGTGQCTPTVSAPDLVLDVDVLSSLWLGAGDLRGAMTAGRAHENQSGVAHRFAAMLRTTRAPWTDVWF